jgi:beta-lactamase class A
VNGVHDTRSRAQTCAQTCAQTHRHTRAHRGAAWLRRVLPLLALAGRLPAQSCPTVLTNAVTEIAHGARGTMGIAIHHVERNESVALNAAQPLPMQSVFKMPIAIDLLNEVDHRRIDLAQSITVTPRDLAPGASPMATTVLQDGRHTYTLRQLLDLMMGQSDNSAADLLLRTVGGASHVEQFLHDHGIVGIDVSLTEREMAEEYYGMPFPVGAADPRGAFADAVQREAATQRATGARAYSADPRNTATPAALATLLTRLETHAILSTASSTLLLDIMTRSPVIPERLRGLLPPDAPVAHKSGSSASTDGVTAATNDVGVITLPDHSHLVVAVLIKNSDAPGPTRDSAIARVAKLAYDCWSH